MQFYEYSFYRVLNESLGLRIFDCRRSELVHNIKYA